MTRLKLLQDHTRAKLAGIALTLVVACWAGVVVAGRAGEGIAAEAKEPQPQGSTPNILFFILDDVGIDQFRSFGYGGLTPPRTPSIDAIAKAGVRFRNAWSMPECSPSRAMFFEGRYPFRTNIGTAILALDLANSQVSPYETTTPKILRNRGYESGLFGKFHLTGSSLNPANNPLGDQAVFALGWDYFAGWEDGAPRTIDSTAGGVAPTGTYRCGFVPSKAENASTGADTGACYVPNVGCTVLTKSAAIPTPGRTCMERGGIFVPNAVCQSTPPSNLTFDQHNGYYVGQLVFNRPDGSVEVVPPSDPRSRGYRTIIESDQAIDWIKTRAAGAPWMATVSYSSAHAPYQQPPTALLPAASAPTGGFNCEALPQQRVLQNQMIESMDAEIGRILVETGLATREPDGTLNYRPEETNTMVVLVGDNGTYYPGVKAPFNFQRSKGSVYQTGVSVPLLVAGPLVRQPGRAVEHMVNVADIFQLFGEIAGLDVHKLVPRSRPLDSVAMLPYLLNPEQPSLRKTNFTQQFDNIKASGQVASPCVLAALNTCLQVFPQRQLCQTEGGTWYGPNGAAGAEGLTSCCAVNKYLLSTGQPVAKILPTTQTAIRDDTFKLVKKETPEYNAQTDKCELNVATEFYRINQDAPVPRLDNEDRNLLGPDSPPLNQRQSLVFASLSRQMEALLASDSPCPGDGNQDGRVNELDFDEWWRWSTVNGGRSSWFDFNYDGFTNSLDLDIISQRFGRRCPRVIELRAAGATR